MNDHVSRPVAGPAPGGRGGKQDVRVALPVPQAAALLDAANLAGAGEYDDEAEAATLETASGQLRTGGRARKAELVFPVAQADALLDAVAFVTAGEHDWSAPVLRAMRNAQSRLYEAMPQDWKDDLS